MRSCRLRLPLSLVPKSETNLVSFFAVSEPPAFEKE
jgi:hypothetical protein